MTCITDFDWHWISLYTCAEDSVYLLPEDLLVNIRDDLSYYSRENLVEYSSADLNMSRWGISEVCYQISGTHQWEECPAPDEIFAEMDYLTGAITEAEFLTQLEQ